ncbi:MAG: 4Fe-4S dicluster domain-containing protein [Candidatus Methylomirabilales bacterium]
MSQEVVTVSQGHKTLILLCAALEKLGSGLNLQDIGKWLGEGDSAVEVRAIPDLCDRPGEVVEAVATSGATHLVLGLCSREYPQIEFHAHARRVGIEPFGIEVVNLGGYCALVHPRAEGTDKAKLLLHAAVARSRAFPGTHPESVKPVISWDQTLSRRALFTLPPLHYEPVPCIRREDCAFEDGCRVCAMTCPWHAMHPSEEGLMVLEKSRCTGCGACVSACPQTAIDLPGVSPQQVNAQIDALLNGASLSIGPRAIFFVCARSAQALEELAQKGLSYPAGWLPVEVPCVGMVTPTWLLQSLNLGATATGVLPCLRTDCRYGQRGVTEGRVAYCRAFLETLGAPPDSVKLLDPRDERQLARALNALPDREKVPGRDRSSDIRLFTPRGATQALLGMTERFAPSSDGSFAHPYSPVGLVRVEQGCTTCEACVHVCPTGALTMESDEDMRELTFDAGLCIGCEACVPVCPERVVRVEKVTDLSRLARGKLTLHRGSETRCQACGAAVAPGAMLERIAGMLGAEDSGTLSFISRYCTSCRGTLMLGGGSPQSDIGVDLTGPR